MFYRWAQISFCPKNSSTFCWATYLVQRPLVSTCNFTDFHLARQPLGILQLLWNSSSMCGRRFHFISSDVSNL
ncbi:hypothetical protein VNO78_23668 [Psophocarpus tetragonolobus]|uniref:Uncharacterized protein n=1 Tax=Psophocarpus tetragonolobus TaxID=3891 RepID=A0AAN9S587_PSOTE